MNMKLSKKETIRLLVIIISFLLFSYLFSRWDAIEQMIKNL